MAAGAFQRFPRFARRQDLGLGVRDFARLQRLDSPQRIQAFLNAIPINHELEGETVHSVRNVLRHRRAHCIEGAFVAACALWIHGEPPLVMHLDCALSDYPHVIALYRRHGCWGAISKTNAVFLRFRDPVYRTLRELALSYFHEYSDRRGHRTLRSYSGAFDLRRVDVAHWVSSEENCWDTHDRLAALRHYPLVKARVVPHLSRRDPFEQKVAGAVQYPKPKLNGRRVLKVAVAHVARTAASGSSRDPSAAHARPTRARRS